MGPVSHRPVSTASASTAAATAVPACSISRSSGHAERLRAAVGAAHLLGADRRQGRSVGPALARPRRSRSKSEGSSAGSGAVPVRAGAGLVDMAGQG